MAGTIEAKFDITGAIIAFESGQLDHDGELELLQNLLDSGMYLHLQGSYGRAVQRALDAGYISVTPVCRTCGPNGQGAISADGFCARCESLWAAANIPSTRATLGDDYETVKHFAQSNPCEDAISLAELVSAKLGIELTVQQAADILAALDAGDISLSTPSTQDVAVSYA